MENQRRLDKARNSCGIGRMPDVSLEGADITELLLGGLAFKDCAQRFEFNRVADWACPFRAPQCSEWSRRERWQSAWARAMTSACPSTLGARNDAGRAPLLFLPVPRMRA